MVKGISALLQSSMPSLKFILYVLLLSKNIVFINPSAMDPYLSECAILVTNPHSFPSGHAARSFLIAVIASVLAPPWLVVVLWVWAPLVGLARVAMGVHYVSDVIAGAILGMIIGLIGLQVYQPMIDWLTGLIGFPLW